MEGRRVSHTSRRRNPLYVLFLCLIAAVFVLLIVAIVLGAKLASAQKALDTAKTQIEALQETPSKPTDPTQTTDPTPESGRLEGDNTPAVNPTDPEEPSKTDDSWLNLSGHSEIQVKPKTLFDQYYTYYTNESVNLRGGPGTSYERILTMEKGAQVKAAAKDGDWTFISVNGKFGWVKSEFLSVTKPAEEKPAEKPAEKPTAEATSGSLKVQR